MMPASAPRTKPDTVSITVTPMWNHTVPERAVSHSRATMRKGRLTQNSLASPVRHTPSHRATINPSTRSRSTQRSLREPLAMIMPVSPGPPALPA
jgi:hypothetical protein